MKTRWVLLAGVVGFIINTSSFAYPSQSCSPCQSTTQRSYCADEATNSCNCTDPTCDSGNPCLSKSKCCEVFGNIGHTPKTFE